MPAVKTLGPLSDHNSNSNSRGRRARLVVTDAPDGETVQLEALCRQEYKHKYKYNHNHNHRRNRNSNSNGKPGQK